MSSACCSKSLFSDMIDLNDISFTLPVQVVANTIPPRCNSATPLTIRRIQTPQVTFSPQCLHDSLDALGTELCDDGCSGENRLDIICRTLGTIADEIDRLPIEIKPDELAFLLTKINSLFDVAERKEVREHATVAKRVRNIQTPMPDFRSFRTKTPSCPLNIQHVDNDLTPRRFLFP
jgi:hypothetical protein